MALPKTTQARICKDALAAAKGIGDEIRKDSYYHGYIAGATAEAERAQGMYDRLCFIRERFKQAQDGQRLNYEALIWGIDHELAEWKGAGKEVEYHGTILSEPAPGIAIGCISPEASELLDTIMEQWDKHYKKVKTEKYEPTFYAFAYWLTRWSGLIQPAAKAIDRLCPHCGKDLSRDLCCRECGKEVERPTKIETCGHCGNLPANHYLGNQLYLCDECMEKHADDCN